MLQNLTHQGKELRTRAANSKKPRRTGAGWQSGSDEFVTAHDIEQSPVIEGAVCNGLAVLPPGGNPLVAGATALDGDRLARELNGADGGQLGEGGGHSASGGVGGRHRAIPR